MDPTEAEWDAFLSHAGSDKPFVRRLATRLDQDGIRVWMDEKTLRPGDNISQGVANGIERSRTLVCFISRSSLQSDWAKSELNAAIFRDPANQHRRFVTVRLDDADLPDFLKPYKYIDWRDPEDEEAYWSLVDTLTGGRAESGRSPTFHDIFTPGAPPSMPTLLVGRDEQLQDLGDLLLSPGIHPIIIGPRGVGKTSLVRQAMKKVKTGLSSVLEVNTVRSFDECCRTILADLGLEADRVPMTGAAFLRALKTLKARAVVSIDELDDLPVRSPIREEFARFAKAASNQAADLKVKFIFSGIGADAHDLFGGHESSLRNLPQIRLEPLNEDDFRSFLDKAERLLGIRLSESVKTSLSAGSDGFPYYFHQVGFHTFAAFTRDNDATVVTDKHLEDGREAALNAAFSHYLRRYKFTFYKLPDAELHVLAEAVEAYRMRFDYDDFESRVERRGSLSTDTVKTAIRSLVNKGYLDYRKGDRSLVFADPLLKPFLRARLRLPLAKLSRRTRNTPNASQPSLFET